VPRILAPIVQCLEQIERIYTEDEGVKNLIKRSFGGLEKLKKDILYDFFKTAFDGSGKRVGGREGGREGRKEGERMGGYAIQRWECSFSCH